MLEILSQYPLSMIGKSLLNLLSVCISSTDGDVQFGRSLLNHIVNVVVICINLVAYVENSFTQFTFLMLTLSDCSLHC